MEKTVMVSLLCVLFTIGVICFYQFIKYYFEKRQLGDPILYVFRKKKEEGKWIRDAEKIIGILFVIFFLIYPLFTIQIVTKDYHIFIILLYFTVITLWTIILILNIVSMFREEYVTVSGLVTKEKSYHWKDVVGYYPMDSRHLELFVEKKIKKEWKQVGIIYHFRQEEKLQKLLGFFYMQNVMRRLR